MTLSEQPATDSSLSCIHAKAEHRIRPDKLNRPQILLQCVSCGKRLSDALPRKNFSKEQIAAMPPWVPRSTVPKTPIHKISEEERRADRQRARAARRILKMRRRDAYEDYLNSEKWQVLRRKILARAKGICEGCGERPAVEVHHLTYERLGDEMLFDLVAVCKECHDKIHERLRAAAEVNSSRNSATEPE